MRTDMRNLVLVAVAAAALSGCQSFGLGSLTPSQQAALYCAVTADGTAIAVSLTKGGAQATALKAQAVAVVTCPAATTIGQIVAAPVPPVK
jgi:uncharacterized protein YceK